MECRNAVFGPLNPVPHEEYMSWYRNTGIDIDNRRNKIEKCAKNVEQDLKAFIEYAKAVPGFRDLCIEDQINLLRGANFLLLMQIFFSFFCYSLN